MSVPQSQREMEEDLKARMKYYESCMADAVYGRLRSKFVGCDLAARYVEVSITTEPWMRNNNGVVHGGVLAAAIDSTDGLIARSFSRSDKIAPTVNMQVSYLRPVTIPSEIHVRAGVTYPGGRLIHTRAELFFAGEEDRPCAVAQAVHYVVD